MARIGSDQKYDFKNGLNKWSGWGLTKRDAEFKRVIRNVIYTTLEAEFVFEDTRYVM